MSLTTETTIHQTEHRSTVAEDPRDPREAGDEMSGADVEIWTEIDRAIETGNRTGTESGVRESGTEKGKMTEVGIAGEVRKDMTAGLQKDAKTGNREKEATVATRGAKEKYKTNLCLRGRDFYCHRKE